MLTHEQLLQAIPSALAGVTVPGWPGKQTGKVRDLYTFGRYRVLITTDRISAFDRVLGLIPHKGQVLNQLSAWWFAQTRDIVANHVVAAPDPNVTIAREAMPLPVEVVVRGYITGVTKTSLWHLYAQGERAPYGIPLPDGLRKNDPLPQPIITPTTKATGGGHDEQLTREQIVRGGLLDAGLWEQVEQAALALFARGQEIARRAGLILVDTKYEFGLCDGQLVVIDEIHTPDSSRYWTAESYAAGEPEHFDKEFLRKWYAERGYRGDGEPPAMPADFVAQVAARYIAAYEKVTGQAFAPAEVPAEPRIIRALQAWRAGLPQVELEN
ncbi:MAG: phosphoribosylaminoimidazolesuccinocarboxamide synthase [Anaerolineae bacterium]